MLWYVHIPEIDIEVALKAKKTFNYVIKRKLLKNHYFTIFTWSITFNSKFIIILSKFIIFYSLRIDKKQSIIYLYDNTKMKIIVFFINGELGPAT